MSADNPAPPADPTYRKPLDGAEAVRAKRAGVLERNMDGVPGGPGGWHPCGLAESWLQDHMFSIQVGASLSCNEAEIVAGLVRAVTGSEYEAQMFLYGHSDGDDEPTDEHHGMTEPEEGATP